MTKLISAWALMGMFFLACSQKQETPESTAKKFVQDYFYSEARPDIQKYVIEAALEKIKVEDEFIEKLNDEKSEMDRPVFFSLIDTLLMNTDFTQYKFSIHYQNSVTRNESMIVTLKRTHTVWKVSDYRFKHTGE